MYIYIYNTTRVKKDISYFSLKTLHSINEKALKPLYLCIIIYTTQVKKVISYFHLKTAKHKWKKFQHLFINKHPTQTQAVKVTALKSHHSKLYPCALTQARVNKNKPSYLFLNTFKHVKTWYHTKPQVVRKIDPKSVYAVNAIHHQATHAHMHTSIHI